MRFYSVTLVSNAARTISANFNHLQLIDKWARAGIQEAKGSIIGCSHERGAGGWHGPQDSDGWVARWVQLCHNTAHKRIPQVHHRVTWCSQTQWLQECDGKDGFTMTWVRPLTLTHSTSITLLKSGNKMMLEHVWMSLTSCYLQTV